MHRFRKTLRPASSVRASAFSRRPAWMNAAVTGGADFKAVSQLVIMTAKMDSAAAPTISFISERESEDRPQLEVGLVARPRDLCQRGNGYPISAMANGNVWTGKKSPGFGTGPIRELELVNELRAYEETRAYFVAQA